MGVRIISPKIAIAALVLKLCFSSQRIGSESRTLMQLAEIYQLVRTRTGRSSSNSNKSTPSGKKLWKDNGQKMMQERNIIIKNGKSIEITKNKNTMEHAQDHAEIKTKSKDSIANINHVMLWKIDVLPCRILGLDGTKTTECGEKYEKKLAFVEITNADRGKS